MVIHTKYPSLIRLRIEALCERERESTRRLCHTYQDIISIENLLAAWQEFLCGKRRRKDVTEFSLHLMDNIVALHRELIERTYRHGPYRSFRIHDPKQRDIHKASVRDRLIHHAIHRILDPYFDRKFVFDSFSCRESKGTHRAINRFRELGRKVSRNHTRTAWVLQCDIRKFFANIDHEVLTSILKKHIEDTDVFQLLGQVVGSFHTGGKSGVGLPIGNLTSQLLVNVYMNEFDQFMKRALKVRYYLRYADDFVILHENRAHLAGLVPKVSTFLGTQLKLSLHPQKIFIKTLASGIDFLGWVHFPHHRVLRTTTKRRMVRKLHQNCMQETIASYVGLLSHGSTHKLRQKLRRLSPKIEAYS